MYFPGDPLLDLDPILNSVPSEEARRRLVADYAHDRTRPEWALGYRFDFVLGGRNPTPFESTAEAPR
ncbi:MAG: protocatechuate 3,4-dioxygenase subunit beta, partial [Actinomycetota bacterium]